MSIDIAITDGAHDRLWAYTMAVPTEIGGFGYATLDASGQAQIHEVFLIPQERGPAAVDYDDRSWEYLITKMAEDKVHDDPHFTLVKWHTHADMGVYFSPTDDDINKKLRGFGLTHLIDIVTNRKREITARVELYGLPLGIEQQTVEKVNIQRAGAFVTDEIKRDVAELTKLEKPTDVASGKGMTTWSRKDWFSTPGDRLDAAFAVADSVAVATVESTAVEETRDGKEYRVFTPVELSTMDKEQLNEHCYDVEYVGDRAYIVDLIDAQIVMPYGLSPDEALALDEWKLS